MKNKASTILNLWSIITNMPSQLKSFDYAVQYLPPKKEGEPTVVYILGGPGQTSIGDDERWFRYLHLNNITENRYLNRISN